MLQYSCFFCFPAEIHITQPGVLKVVFAFEIIDFPVTKIGTASNSAKMFFVG